MRVYLIFKMHCFFFFYFHRTDASAALRKRRRTLWRNRACSCTSASRMAFIFSRHAACRAGQLWRDRSQLVSSLKSSSYRSQGSPRFVCSWIPNSEIRSLFAIKKPTKYVLRGQRRQQEARETAALQNWRKCARFTLFQAYYYTEIKKLTLSLRL